MLIATEAVATPLTIEDWAAAHAEFHLVDRDGDGRVLAITTDGIILNRGPGLYSVLSVQADVGLEVGQLVRVERGVISIVEEGRGVGRGE